MKFNFSINKMRELVLKYPFLKPFDKEVSRQLLEEIEREIEKLNKAINEYKKNKNNYYKEEQKLRLKPDVKEAVLFCNFQKQILQEYLSHAKKINSFNERKAVDKDEKKEVTLSSDLLEKAKTTEIETFKISELTSLYLYLLNTLVDLDLLKQVAIRLMVIYSSSDSKLKEEIEPLLNSLKHQTIIKRRKLKKQNKKALVNKLKEIYSILDFKYEEITFYDNRTDIIKYFLSNPNNYDKIKRLIELMPDILNISINNQNIIFVILDYYFESCLIELKNQTSTYIPKEYYEKIFNLFVNHPYFNKEYEALIQIKIEEFVETIKHYKKYPEILKSIYNLGKQEENNIEDFINPNYSSFGYLYRRQMDLNERVEDSPTFAITSLDNSYINKCYSANINEKGRVVIKVHTIDISAYVKYDELESYFRNKMFTGENPIFPMDIITNYLSFEPMIKRPAITYEIELSNNGRIASFDIYRSIVSLDKIYSYDNFILPNKEVTFSYYTLLNDFDLDDKDFGKTLEKMYLSKVSRAVGTYFTKKGLPCIYRVQAHQDEDSFVRDMNVLNSLMGKLDRNTAKVIYQIICEDTNRAYYASENIGHDGCGQAYFLDLFSPIDSYITLTLQKLIDDFYINERKYKSEEWQQEIKKIIVLANQRRVEHRTKEKQKSLI